jgi:hypothetical protein
MQNSQKGHASRLGLGARRIRTATTTTKTEVKSLQDVETCPEANFRAYFLIIGPASKRKYRTIHR